MAEEQDEQERPKPRVVDKRVSARGADTPGSEPKAQPSPPAPEPDPPTAQEPQPAAGPGPEAVWTPEQEQQAQQLARELAERPSIEWVLNLAVTLANVAGAKLDVGSPQDARLAIDTLAAIVEGVGSELQNAQQPLRQTLAQLQLAYAEAMGGPKT